MNYEQKYKEALNKAQKELQCCGDLDCDAARQIFRLFPELAENKDERISREITKFLVDYYNGEYERPNENTIDSWLSWLKKQGEQKSAWNKEDEQFFNTALWHISYSISNGKSTDINCDTTDWLKSLKYRIKGE